MNKFSHPAMQLLVLLGYMLLMLVVANLINALLAAVGLDLQGRTMTYVVQAVGQVLMFLVPAVLVARRYRGDGWRRYLGLDWSGRSWLMAVVAVAAMLLAVPLVDWSTVWNDGWSFGPLDGALRDAQRMNEAATAKLLGGTTAADLAVNLLVVALVPAVCEEMFFRAGVLNLLRRWMPGGGRSGTLGTHVAIWLTAAIFSLVHLEAFAFVPRLLLGAMLGYFYVYGGSIVVNTAAHFANNAAVVVMWWLAARGAVQFDPAAPLCLPWLLTVCCSVAAVALCVAFMRGGRSTAKTVN